MVKLTIEDLKTIKEKAQQKEKATVIVTVHMGTCGITAGAREVMNALVEEMAEAERADIQVIASGCLGMCSSEPNVTVEIEDEKPIVYKLIDANKMRQIFKRHVLLGEVQTDFALAKM